MKRSLHTFFAFILFASSNNISANPFGTLATLPGDTLYAMFTSPHVGRYAAGAFVASRVTCYFIFTRPYGCKKKTQNNPDKSDIENNLLTMLAEKNWPHAVISTIGDLPSALNLLTTCLALAFVGKCILHDKK